MTPPLPMPQDAPAGPSALSVEQIHSLLRRMSDEDWYGLKTHLLEHLSGSAQHDVELLERMFRKGEALAGQAGGIIFRLVQVIMVRAPLRDELRKANERSRARVRFVLKEMADNEWETFKMALRGARCDAYDDSETRVLELVFRLGESVSNVEIAAQALLQKSAPRKWLAPEVARQNARMKAKVPAQAEAEGEAAYQAAKQVNETMEGIARRGENTLAYGFVEPSQAFRHARNTVFKMVDLIAEHPKLMAEISRIEQGLQVPSLSRERLRYALHRMPRRDRLAVIKLVPLNTILMFQDCENSLVPQSQNLRATRDRRLAYDLFVRGQSDEELARAYELSINAVKNTVGVILENLRARPLARTLANRYLAQAEQVPSMSIDEARRAMKQVSSRQRAEILDRIPNCAWKVRHVIPLHKHLFLDYFSGEWVLGALVAYYNLQKAKRLTGLFIPNGTLTLRGANSALEGILRKIADEPDLRRQLRRWCTPGSLGDVASAEPSAEAEDLEFERLLLAPTSHMGEGLHATGLRLQGEPGLSAAVAA